MQESAIHPIIYVRGYAMSQDEIENTVADPYMGFNIGSSKMRQLWDGKVKKYFFESPLVRLLKTYKYDDVYEEGLDRVADAASLDPAEAKVPVPYRSIVIYRYYEPSSEDLGTGQKPDMKRFATGLGQLILDLRDRIYPQGAQTVITPEQEEKGKLPYDQFRVYLVAHSMGGLVCRSAAYRAVEDRMSWVKNVSHVVSLGTPHRGAPLEEIVHVGSAALTAMPETQPVARFLRRRSGGIRDLRRGSLVDEDWQDRDPDALRAAACKEIPLLDGAKHCFVSASLTRSPRNPLGRLIGDMLVLGSSAAPWREEEAFHLSGANHFALLNHPQVYERLREWLA